MIKKTSALYKLDPFVDNEGIIRVGGRVRRSSLPVSIKHPIVLPRKGHITELLLRHFHETTNNQGHGMTSNEIRANGFWIIGCSSVVSRFIFRCVVCRKLRSKVQEQKMADLPQDRVEESPPFSYCGVDIFGPFEIKERRKLLKTYGALFTCLTSKAVHVEVVASMSSDSFINALRRVLAIRGPIRELRSDRGSNFVGARNEFKEAKLEFSADQIKDFLLKENCDMKFNMNVPSTSHMGGCWERQIRTVRSVLTSLLEQCGHHLDDEGLRTFMYEAAAVVNSRPLSVNNLYDPKSLEPLTPNNLLTMKSKIVLPPPGNFKKADVYSKKQWRRVQYMLEQFWNRGRREVVQNLQERSKWIRPRRNLEIVNIVLMKDENLSRNQWPMARVEEAYMDKDNRVRKVIQDWTQMDDANDH